MSKATMTSKNQLTVPEEVRRTLHLAPGDRLTFDCGDDGRVVVTKDSPAAEELFQRLKVSKRLSDRELRDARKEAWGSGRARD
ncbi:MAG: AbrB/MazE/SpoVT family DNA-binding domain-containing protein [Myxococcota bacterium]